MFLLKNTPENLWAVPVRDPTARDQLLKFKEDLMAPTSLPTFRVLIAHLDQLHNFVQQVPPLAWELLEYAQEPLEIIYPVRKFSVSPDNDAPRLCARWAKHPKLLRFLQKEGPAWSILASDSLINNLPPYVTIDCHDKSFAYQRVKTVLINTDDTFTFLR